MPEQLKKASKIAGYVVGAFLAVLGLPQLFDDLATLFGLLETVPFSLDVWFVQLTLWLVGLGILVLTFYLSRRRSTAASTPSFSLRPVSGMSRPYAPETWARLAITNKSSKPLAGCAVRLTRIRSLEKHPLVQRYLDNECPPRTLPWSLSEVSHEDERHTYLLLNDNAEHLVDVAFERSRNDSCTIISCNPPAEQNIGPGAVEIEVSVSSTDESSVPLVLNLLFRYRFRNSEQCIIELDVLDKKKTLLQRFQRSQCAIGRFMIK